MTISKYYLYGLMIWRYVSILAHWYASIYSAFKRQGLFD